MQKKGVRTPKGWLGSSLGRCGCPFRALDGRTSLCRCPFGAAKDRGCPELRRGLFEPLSTSLLPRHMGKCRLPDSSQHNGSIIVCPPLQAVAQGRATGRGGAHHFGDNRGLAEEGCDPEERHARRFPELRNSHLDVRDGDVEVVVVRGGRQEVRVNPKQNVVLGLLRNALVSRKTIESVRGREEGGRSRAA